MSTIKTLIEQNNKTAEEGIKKCLEYMAKACLEILEKGNPVDHITHAFKILNCMRLDQSNAQLISVCQDFGLDEDFSELKHKSLWMFHTMIDLKRELESAADSMNRFTREDALYLNRAILNISNRWEFCKELKAVNKLLSLTAGADDKFWFGF